MESLEAIRFNMAVARAQSPLANAGAVLLGASKGQSAQSIEAFIQAGLVHFGENRVQEAQDKWPEIKKRHPQITLHLIGSLQTNKVADALALFDVVQTLDRPRLADEIAKRQEADVRCQKFFVQVNTGEEPQKAGVSPAEASSFIAYCKNLGLNVVGLMCVPPADQMPAPHFALLKKIADAHGLKELSMGMSGDYETAIRMGSTCVRIGTALFGQRRATV